MMEKGGDHEGVINLSTVTKEGPSPPTHNGDTHSTENGDIESQGQLPHSPHSKATTGGGAAKRKTKSNSMVELGAGITPPGPHPSLMMMAAAQHGLMPPQMQQLLQQQNQGLSPQQLQQIMQHQSMMLQHQQQQKLQDQVLQELNEQLQINMLQQSQLMQQQQQPDKSKVGKGQLQQLALQQQQLVQQIQQIQIQQRQYLLACLVQPFGVPQGMMSPGEIQQLWKEVASQSGLDESAMKSNGTVPTSLGAGLPSLSFPTPPTSWATNGITDTYLNQGNTSLGHSTVQVKQEQTSPTSSYHALFRHCLCKWPGCDTHCEDYMSFLKHLSAEHTLDDRSTAQARVQMQVVSQLEIQLTREKDLLQEMMKHLHMKPTDSKPQSGLSVSSEASQKPLTTHSPPITSSNLLSQLPSPNKPVTVSSSPLKLSHLPLSMSVSAPPTPVGLVGNPMSLPLLIPPPLGQTPVSKPSTPLSQASSLPTTPTSAGPMRRRVSDKCNLPISAEIQRNRDFYKSTDVRPPFTYASLIRQAIIESPHKQLTLNEIYQWFQNTFAYFRRNEATWKNAVRHNLSLHKCFMRVENVKGAVWTVDEVEFYKRRPQKLGGNLSKSPSLQSEHSVFGENLNASLRVALEQANSMMNHQLCNGNVSVDGVEDLSMKSSRNSSSESLAKLELPARDELLGIKSEPDMEPDTFLENGHSPLDRVEGEDVRDLEEGLTGSGEEFEEEEAAMETACEDMPQSQQSVSPYGQLSPSQDLYLQSLPTQQSQETVLSHTVTSTIES